MIFKRKNLKPLILSACLILADQITKYIVTLYIPLNSREGIIKVTNDFLWFIHVRNKGAAFSIGVDFQQVTRILVLYILPLILIVSLIYIVIFSNKWDTKYKYLMAGIIGGGLGNMIDRIFRPDGVVDFISVKFYGFLGMERWPTFNIADSTVVVCMILWLIFTFLPEKKHTDDTSSITNTH